ncbi:MAG: hypothetical protein QM831_21330 [Kofleriaceae bacterium]
MGWLERAEGKTHRSWVEQKIGKLTASDEADATSRLAELRALGTLLSTCDAPMGDLSVAPNPTSGKKKSPDFLISSSPPTFIEVCCARWNDGERARQERIDSAEARMLPAPTEQATAAALANPDARITAKASTSWTDPDGRTERHEMTVGAMALPAGGVATFTLAHRIMQPQGRPKDEADAHAVARSVSGKKPPGQVPSGSPGILWMDFCDAEWALHAVDALPATIEWKGMPLATTRGVWHAFYGQKGKTRFFTRAAISLGLGAEMANASVQQFDARLRNDAHRCWSAAVLRCVDGVVIFENPNPLVPLPFRVLRELVGLEGYKPELSFHRLAEDDFEGLRGRLEDVEKRLQFYIGDASFDRDDEHD